MRKVIALLKNDLKNISKDKLTLYASIMPLPFLFALGWFMRKLPAWLPDYNVEKYYPFIQAGGILFAPGIFAFLIGLLFIEEKESRILQAIRITPLPPGSFVLYRISIGIVISIVYGFLSVLIMNLAKTPVQFLIPIVITTSLQAPIFGLLLAVLAKNKVEGMAVGKGVTLLVELPLVSIFITTGFKYFFAVMPGFWPLWGFYYAATGQTGLSWLFIAVGLVYHVALLFPLIKAFDRKTM